MVDHQPMPVQGYTAQSQEKIDLVNEGKQLEERVLRYIERVDHFNQAAGNYALPDGAEPNTSVRCLRNGVADISGGFMWVFRSIFNPQRIPLPEDKP